MTRLILFVRGPWNGRVEALYPPHEFTYRVHVYTPSSEDSATLTDDTATYRRRTYVIEQRQALQVMALDDGNDPTHADLIEALTIAARLEMQRIPQ